MGEQSTEGPDQELRAARVKVQEAGSILRQALAADDQSARAAEESDR